MPQYQPPSEIEELKAWMEAVRPVPRFLWTKETAALMDALASLDLAAPFATIAAHVGRSRAELTAQLRVCPVQLGPGTPERPT